MKKDKLKSTLFKAIKTGAKTDEIQVYSLIYDYFFTRIFAYSKSRFPNEAEDIVQSFFCYKVLRMPMDKLLEKFPYLESFLILSLANHCNTKHRRGSFSAFNKKDKNHKPDTLNMLSNPLKTELSLDLEKAINKLPLRQKKAFLLHYHYGYKYSELAEIMKEDLSSEAAKQLVFRAKQKLKKYLST